MFLTTLSFLITLPGWDAALGGFPALSAAGGFLLKDVVLLAVAITTLAESVLSCPSPHRDEGQAEGAPVSPETDPGALETGEPRPLRRKSWATSR